MQFGKCFAACAAGALSSIVFLSPARAAVVYTTAGAQVTQDFNSLGASGSISWTNDSTLPGWSLFVQPAPGTPPASILAGDGASNTGSFYSFGTGAGADRALGGTGSGGSYFGSPSSGNVAGWMAVAVTNSTGSMLNSFTVGYDGEQWRNGGNTSAQTMVMEYGFGNAFDGVSTWTPAGSAFNFVSPIVGSTGTALDGNAAANRVADIGGTVTNLTWGNGSTLWIRWTENNDVGNDHGLGIDAFRFSASPVPEPTGVALLGIGMIVPMLRRRRPSSN